MNDVVNKMSDKAAIASWEDEGGALKPVLVTIENDNTFLVWICCLVVLPIFYWLIKRL